MRRILAGVVTVASVIGLMGTSVGASGKVYDAQCDTSGTIALTPGLGAAAQAETLTASGVAERTAGFCTKSPGSVSGTLASPSLSCDSAANMVGQPAVGKLIVTWADHSRSTIRVSLTPHPVVHAPSVFFLSGTVKKGVYAGDRVTGRAWYDAGSQTCETGVTSYDYQFGGKFTTLLDFAPPG